MVIVVFEKFRICVMQVAVGAGGGVVLLSQRFENSVVVCAVETQQFWGRVAFFACGSGLGTSLLAFLHAMPFSGTNLLRELILVVYVNSGHHNEKYRG
jgi:hypothetical protein